MPRIHRGRRQGHVRVKEPRGSAGVGQSVSVACGKRSSATHDGIEPIRFGKQLNKKSTDELRWAA
jgi:hypothetical protein